MKTVRFSQVVERSGHPRVHALWVAPERDAELKAAEKTHRVMTVAPPERGKPDVGTVGFDPQLARTGQVLIFPKSLQRFAKARVVGVKFDLVEQPATHAARIAETLAGTGRAPRKHRKPAPPTTMEPTSPETQEPATATLPAVASGRKASRPPSPARRTGFPAGDDDSAVLKHAIRAALEELRDGRTVAAYQRLERALR